MLPIRICSGIYDASYCNYRSTEDGGTDSVWRRNLAWRAYEYEYCSVLQYTVLEGGGRRTTVFTVLWQFGRYILRGMI